MRAPSPQRDIISLLQDQTGTILTTEMLLIATTLILGMIVGLASMRDAVISELSDVAGALQDFDQSFSFNGVDGHSAGTHGTSFQDGLDFCDNAGDTAGVADNCIVFDRLPTDEGEVEPEPTWVLSEVGTFDFDNVTTGSGGSATGTIGDGTIDTNFTVTTDTGNIAGTTGANQVRFRENPANDGTFTITYDDPLTDFEFWIRDMGNVAGEPENLLGNFTLTLSDGTVINNAAFTILPDAIGPNQTYGLFETRGNDQSQIAAVNRGGLDYVTDSSYNGSSDQSAGRLIFPGIPALGADCVGVTSLSFERSGGPNGYQATFSTSGRVITPGP